MEKCKLLIYSMIFLLMINIVSAVTLRNCNYGEGVYGAGAYGVGYCPEPEVPFEPVGTGTSGGTQCGEDEFYFLGFCLPNIFKSMVAFWNTTSLMFWESSKNPPQLEYTVSVPESIFVGEDLNITNRITNEGDIDSELTCTNFVDTIKDGEIQPTEPSVGFSKLVKSNETLEMKTIIRMPINMTPDRYFIGGHCTFVDGLNSTAFDFVNVKKRSILEESELVHSKVLSFIKNNYLWLLLGIVLFLLLFKLGVIQILFKFIFEIFEFLLTLVTAFFIAISAFGIIALIALFILFLYLFVRFGMPLIDTLKQFIGG